MKPHEGRELALATCARVLDLVGDRGEAEVTVTSGRSGLTRFANSFIHQNVAEDGIWVRLRVVVDGRSATASTTRVATGLSDMVDELGGINIDVPVPMNDPLSGAVFPAGTVRMDGGAALAFARNRHLTGPRRLRGLRRNPRLGHRLRLAHGIRVVHQSPWGRADPSACEEVARARHRRSAHRARRAPRVGASMSTHDESRRRFRTTLFRVMAVQIITLLLLWLLQRRYTA